jgi:hypothetical protein
MNLCFEGIVRLLLIIFKFAIHHWGWSVTFLLILLVLPKILKKIPFLSLFEFLDFSVIGYILYLPFLLVIIFFGLVVGIFIASLWSGIPACSIFETMTTYLV